MKTADLVDLHDDKVQVCDLPFLHFGRIQAFFGPVATVKCFEDNVLLRGQLETPGEGRVLVVDAGGSGRVAVMGDMIAALLLENGWAGAIIHGAVRDSAELDQMDIGVRCLSTTPKKSTKDGAGRVDVPVRFGGVTIAPGNWIYSDPDGVLVSEHELKPTA